MNIAHLLPYSAHFPLVKHNGRYEWALRLARIQAQQGHSVTIYASPGSHDNESAITWKSTEHSLGDKLADNTALIKLAFNDAKHDIFHSHFDSLHYSLADSTPKPVIFTQHWFPTSSIADASKLNTSQNVYAVSPTYYMADINKKLGIKTIATIHHGIDLTLFHPVESPAKSRLLFIGRITPSKGVREAVDIARMNHQKLDIVGKINAVDNEYWQSILPYLDGEEITYLGPKSQPEVAGLMAQAKALLFPSQAIEAFGQVLIEAQACGTPVITNNIGANSELVNDGVSGLVIQKLNEYESAVQKLETIDRNNCRLFAQNFDIQTMADAYMHHYTLLTDNS